MKRYYLGIINFFRIRYHWLISYVVIIVVAGFIILQLLRPEASETNYRYLLSAISQSIAALFALIFTISFIVLQVAFRFKGLLREFLSDAFNLIYPVLCGLSIIVPFVVLRFDYYEFWIDLSISIASLCVLLVLPFFLRTKDFLKFNVGIREDVQIAKGLIDRKDVEGYRNYLWEILLLSQSAANQGTHCVIKIALRELLALSKYIYRTNVHAIDAVDETIKQFSVHIQIANRENILSDVWFIVAEAASIPYDTPGVQHSTFVSLCESLTVVAETSRNMELRKKACCSVWVLCARRCVRKPTEKSKIKEIIKDFAVRVGPKFVLKCNDPRGPHDMYENAVWELKLRSEDADALRMVETLRLVVVSSS